MTIINNLGFGLCHIEKWLWIVLHAAAQGIHDNLMSPAHWNTAGALKHDGLRLPVNAIWVQ